MWQAGLMSIIPRAFHCGLLLVFVCLLALSSKQAYAWGNAGHRITAYVAEPLLTDKARKEVQQLLGDESLAEAAVYMDTHRDELAQRWPESARWHYDNRRVCGNAPFRCAGGDCASAQIERFQRLLADRRTDYAQRRMALRVLIHLLGDAHQPLHMSDNDDRGGNNIEVRLYAGAERRRLHQVFDTQLVQLVKGTQRDEAYAAQLLTRFRAQLPRWQQGTRAQWLDESRLLGVNEVYGKLPGFACNHRPRNTLTLPPTYVDQARRYLPEQLAKAGARIAAVLNDTLR